MILKSLFSILLLTTFLSGSVHPEYSTFPILKGPWFGQKTPGDKAVVFAPGLISSNHHEHSRLEFSKDGKSIFWVVIPVDKDYKKKGTRPYMPDKQNICHTRLVNGVWSTPAVVNIKGRTGKGVTVAPDGFVYCKTDKPDADPKLRPKPSQLWKLRYKDGKSDKVVPVENLIPKKEKRICATFSITESGNLYFDYGGPGENGRWGWYIWFSEFKEGKYLTAVKLDKNINFDGCRVRWTPWVAPDESYMIFSANRSDDFGNGDLYISFRNKKGEWSKAVNMGETVNSDKQERFPSVSPDGKYLFFVRHMPETFNDYYWIDAGIIEKLKRECHANSLTAN